MAPQGTVRRQQTVPHNESQESCTVKVIAFEKLPDMFRMIKQRELPDRCPISHAVSVRLYEVLEECNRIRRRSCHVLGVPDVDASGRR